MEADAIAQFSYALDTFYFLVCGALVMWMAAGFAMLEAGLVRAKNTAEILTKNICLYSVACIMYMVCGYAVMYGEGLAFFLPGIAADGVDGAAAGEAATYSPAADFFFQTVFVATAMSIVSGVVAERMKLWSFLLFAAVMTGVLYPIQGGWVWGGKEVFGLYSLDGFLDFAGSGVVHLAGASAALAAAFLLGPRLGKYGADGQIRPIPGCNLPLATLGTFVLWLGWFGFNGGSVLATSTVETANKVAVVFMNTNLAAAGGALGATAASMFLFRKADLTMVLNGALTGLVVITAEPLTPLPLAAAAFGAAGGGAAVFAVITLEKLRLDDPVGAVSVHGMGGLLGLLLVPATNPEASLLMQLAGAATIFVWMFAASFVVWAALRAALGIRVAKEKEYKGLDVAECGLEAYPEFALRRKDFY